MFSELHFNRCQMFSGPAQGEDVSGVHASCGWGGQRVRRPLFPSKDSVGHHTSGQEDFRWVVNVTGLGERAIKGCFSKCVSRNGLSIM